MDARTNDYTLVEKLLRLRYTILMLVTAYSVFVGRISGGFTVIDDVLQIAPHTYAVWMLFAAFIWTFRVMHGYRADGFTLTPLLLYYTMAAYAVIITPGAPLSVIVAYIYIASEMIKLILTNQENYYAARSPITATSRSGGDYS